MHEFDSFDPSLLSALAMAAGEDNVVMSEPMRAHTTFKIGGPADVLVTPETPEALVRVLDVCAMGPVPVLVVGNGSDLLVGDRGVRGVVVLLRENLAAIEVEGSRVRAQAGALLRDVAIAAADAGLSGMEPLWGIPATVGGACFMNAGAYGGSTSDVLDSIEAYVPGPELPDGSRASGRVRTFSREELSMGYRKSRVHDDGLIVLSATFSLVPDAPEQIRSAMDDFQRRREEKQPLEMPSAGSTFKRPEGYFAGKLIHHGCRPARRAGRRRPGVGEALWLRGQRRRRDGCGRQRPHRAYPGRGQAAVRRRFGDGGPPRRRVLGARAASCGTCPLAARVHGGRGRRSLPGHVAARGAIAFQAAGTMPGRRRPGAWRLRAIPSHAGAAGHARRAHPCCAPSDEQLGISMEFNSNCARLPKFEL